MATTATSRDGTVTITISKVFDSKPVAGDLAPGEVGQFTNSLGQVRYVVGTAAGRISEPYDGIKSTAARVATVNQNVANATAASSSTSNTGSTSATSSTSSASTTVPSGFKLAQGDYRFGVGTVGKYNGEYVFKDPVTNQYLSTPNQAQAYIRALGTGGSALPVRTGGSFLIGQPTAQGMPQSPITSASDLIARASPQGISALAGIGGGTTLSKDVASQIYNAGTQYSNAQKAFSTLYDKVLEGTFTGADLGQALKYLQDYSKQADTALSQYNTLVSKHLPTQAPAPGVPAPPNPFAIQSRFTLPQETWSMNPTQLMNWIGDYEKEMSSSSWMDNLQWALGQSLISGAALSGLGSATGLFSSTNPFTTISNAITGGGASAPANAAVSAGTAPFEGAVYNPNTGTWLNPSYYDDVLGVSPGLIPQGDMSLTGVQPSANTAQLDDYLALNPNYTPTPSVPASSPLENMIPPFEGAVYNPNTGTWLNPSYYDDALGVNPILNVPGGTTGLPSTSGSSGSGSTSGGLLDSIGSTLQNPLVAGAVGVGAGLIGNEIIDALTPEQPSGATWTPFPNNTVDYGTGNMLGMPDWWNNLYARGGFGAGNYLGYDILGNQNIPMDVQSLLGMNSGQNTGSTLTT